MKYTLSLSWFLSAKVDMEGELKRISVASYETELTCGVSHDGLAYVKMNIHKQ